MQKEHEELLELVTAAEQKALQIYGAGVRPMEDQVRALRQVKTSVAARIKAYVQAAKAKPGPAPEGPSEPKGKEQPKGGGRGSRAAGETAKQPPAD